MTSRFLIRLRLRVVVAQRGTNRPDPDKQKPKKDCWDADKHAALDDREWQGRQVTEAANKSENRTTETARQGKGHEQAPRHWRKRHQNIVPRRAAGRLISTI
jgi:hypothetical protein